MAQILNVSNLTTSDKRVQLVPVGNSTIANVESLAPNPTVLIDDSTETYTFCLQARILALSCAGAASYAKVRLQGNFDVIIDGKTYLKNTSVEAIADYFSQEYTGVGSTGTYLPIKITLEPIKTDPVSIGMMNLTHQNYGFHLLAVNIDGTYYTLTGNNLVATNTNAQLISNWNRSLSILEIDAVFSISSNDGAASIGAPFELFVSIGREITSFYIGKTESITDTQYAQLDNFALAQSSLVTASGVTANPTGHRAMKYSPFTGTTVPNLPFATALSTDTNSEITAALLGAPVIYTTCSYQQVDPDGFPANYLKLTAPSKGFIFFKDVDTTHTLSFIEDLWAGSTLDDTKPFWGNGLFSPLMMFTAFGAEIPTAGDYIVRLDSETLGFMVSTQAVFIPAENYIPYIEEFLKVADLTAQTYPITINTADYDPTQGFRNIVKIPWSLGQTGVLTIDTTATLPSPGNLNVGVNASLMVQYTVGYDQNPIGPPPLVVTIDSNLAANVHDGGLYLSISDSSYNWLAAGTLTFSVA